MEIKYSSAGIATTFITDLFTMQGNAILFTALIANVID